MAASRLSRSTAASIISRTQAVEQAHFPSKTGTSRLRHSRSHPLLHFGFPHCGSNAEDLLSEEVVGRLVIRTGIVCSPATCGAQRLLSPVVQNFHSPAQPLRGPQFYLQQSGPPGP